jgi:hypothetical protein
MERYQTSEQGYINPRLQVLSLISLQIRLSEYIFEQYGVEVSPDALFDVQVKRIHEYKRQLMNILGLRLFNFMSMLH